MSFVRNTFSSIFAFLLLSITTTFFSASVSAAPLKVGISLVDLSNPFFAILAEQISSELKKSQNDDVEILIHSSAYNLSKQVAQLDDFIDKRVDIIFVAASESEAIAPFVKRARLKGIIVVAVDIESSGADVVVTSDNVQAGYLSCHYLAKKLNHEGEVAIINGQPISSVINRIKGCKQALAESPNIKLVSDTHNSSGTYSGGLESMTYLLIEYPVLKGVFTINDPSGFGAIEAIEQVNRQDIKIVSVDASPEFLEQISKPNTSFIASTAQFPRIMAKRAVGLALQLLNTSIPAPKMELIKTRLVTAKNAKNFYNWEEVKR